MSRASTVIECRLQHAHTRPQLRVSRRAHPVVRTLVSQPLAVGLVHSLAGRGALTATAFAELPRCRGGLQYMTLFGPGRRGIDRRMALGMPRARTSRPGSGHRRLSITVGGQWSMRGRRIWLASTARARCCTRCFPTRDPGEPVRGLVGARRPHSKCVMRQAPRRATRPARHRHAECFLASHARSLPAR